MWGYITLNSSAICRVDVPSLYVRVYHSVRGCQNTRGGFLTVCEGISRKRVRGLQGRQFPHCMWGYIDGRLSAREIVGVPSLYVRVYRIHGDWCRKIVGSLTVCEGISSVVFCQWHWYEFPHCMWGYIDRIRIVCRMAAVPSLYVRVYRLFHIFFLRRQGPLTVCEGVSLTSTLSNSSKMFPHCMWGCIGVLL